jgi:ankyrin repeat protein
MSSAAPQRPFREDAGYYEERAAGLLASARDGAPEALAAFARHGAALTGEGARAALAAEHGEPSWDALLARAAGLEAAGDPFAAAYRALEARDPGALAAALDRDPDAVRARGTNGNDLLGMATATGDARTVALLLARGADPAAANVHGWTALHQAAYMGRPDLARALLEAGAPPATSARGDGGTPLVIALFWGHPLPADLVDAVGLAPGNLRVAAGLGSLRLIDDLVPGAGPPAPAAGAGRGFYRPHGGFPAWRPSDDPREVLDEAVSWAARSGRPGAVAALAERGADLDRDVYRGTPLAWAAACGRVEALRLLLDLGAAVDGRGTFGGADHGEGVTALHLAAESGRLEAIRILLDAGADPTIRDARHGGAPADWAAQGGRPRAEALLRAASS